MPRCVKLRLEQKYDSDVWQGHAGSQLEMRVHILCEFFASCGVGPSEVCDLACFTTVALLSTGMLDGQTWLNEKKDTCKFGDAKI